jgi:hypothetical protein
MNEPEQEPLPERNRIIQQQTDKIIAAGTKPESANAGLQIDVEHHEDKVRFTFNKPVMMLSISPGQAVAMATHMLIKAQEAIRFIDEKNTKPPPPDDQN